jgi:hypothetical protein
MRKIALLAVTLAYFGCGGGGTDPSGGCDDGMQVPPAMRYMPLKEGIKWTYKVTDTGNASVSSKVTTVGAPEKVPGAVKGGVTAFKVTTAKDSSKGVGDQTISWQQDCGLSVARHLERSFNPGETTFNLEEWWDPFKLRLDEHPDHLKVGSYDVTYDEFHQAVGGMRTTQKRSERWTVYSVGQPYTVLGKKYDDCLEIGRRGTDQGATSDKRYWFCKGVGKVKETGGQLEELMAVTGN